METFLPKHRQATIWTPQYIATATDRERAKYAQARESFTYGRVAHRGFYGEFIVPANMPNSDEEKRDALQSMHSSGVITIDLLAESEELAHFLDIVKRWDKRRKSASEKSFRIKEVIEYDVNGFVTIKDSSNLQAFTRTSRFDLPEKTYEGKYKPFARVAPSVVDLNYLRAGSLLEAIEMRNTIYERLHLLKDIKPK